MLPSVPSTRPSVLDLTAPIDQVPLAFLDVETTGLRPYLGDRVCEIAILRCEAGEVVDAFQQLVNPQRPMSLGAYAVHGISDEMVHEAPFFSQVAGDVLALIDGAVWIGHNAPFDLGFVAQELALIGAPMPHVVALDTLRLARRHYYLGSYALVNVARALDVDIGRAHRAMADVVLTRGVFHCLVEHLSSQGARSVSDYLVAQGGVLSFRQLPAFDVPPLILEALRGGHLLHLRYVSRSGQETERDVRPIAVSDQGSSPLLMAHCYLRDALRHFRIDRIQAMELITEGG